MFINTTRVTVMLAEANRGTSVSPTYYDFKASSVSKLSVTGKCSSVQEATITKLRLTRETVQTSLTFQKPRDEAVYV